jgi:nondiscriminating glutamyl-tRNA synthetase
MPRYFCYTIGHESEAMSKIRVRFAPSPTGYVHVGNARTALYNWLFARQKGGVFVLRVEDTDIERSTPEYERKLMDDLGWLGLDWDEGPDVGGEFGPYRQSMRLDIYAAHTQQLLGEGKGYYCFCSPEELESERKSALASGGNPVYSGKCRLLSPDGASQRVKAGEEASIRLRTPGKGNLSFEDLIRGRLTFDLTLVGDPILVRSNGLPAYNYAVVVDDYLMEITHVIRGEDHIANTVRQILTFQALGFPLPEYAHLSMVMGEDNTRLSKRHGATALDQFEQEGILPAALFNYLALLGWAPPDGREMLHKDEMIQLFDMTRVSRSAAIFDYGKLYWLNRQHMKEMSSRDIAVQAAVFLQKAGLFPEQVSDAHWEWLEQAVDSLIERADRFSDLPQSVGMLFEFSLSSMGEEEKKVLESACSAKVIQAFAEKLVREKDFDYDKFAVIAGEIKQETGCTGQDLYRPLRLALTAKASGLDLDKFIPLVEAGSSLDFPQPLKNCLSRVKEVMEFLR